MMYFFTHSDSRFREVRPRRDFFPGGHVGISVSGERSLQLLQLLGGEMRPLPSLSPLLLHIIVCVRVVCRGRGRLFTIDGIR